MSSNKSTYGQSEDKGNQKERQILASLYIPSYILVKGSCVDATATSSFCPNPGRVISSMAEALPVSSDEYRILEPYGQANRYVKLAGCLGGSC